MDAIKKHLLQTVTQDDVIWRMDDLMLRFAFMDKVAGREYTLKFLQEFLAETKSYLRTLRQYQDQTKGTIPATARLAMQNGINNYQMNVRWAERAIRELAKDS